MVTGLMKNPIVIKLNQFMVNFSFLKLIKIYLFLALCMLVTIIPDGYAQDTLQRLSVTQTTSEARGTVFRNHPDKAGIIIESTLPSLRFSSNMNGIVEERPQPDQGRYVLIIEPFTQIISIDAPGFVQERVRIGSPFKV